MKTGDPFTGLLEEVLSAPDFDLGDDLRLCLLDAAEEASGSRVIELVTEESWEVSAFNWLVGEAPSDPALMDRLVEVPAFLDAVVGQQKFLRRLKASLIQPAVLVEPVARRAFRPLRAMMMAAGGLAALIAWMLVVQMSTGPSRGGHAVAERSMATETDSSRDTFTSRETRKASTAVRHVQGFDEVSHHDEVTGKPLPKRDLDSVRTGVELLAIDEATRLAARELFQGGNAVFEVEAPLNESGMEMVLAASEIRPGERSVMGTGQWGFVPALYSLDRSSFPGAGGSTIPEPSGLLLVAVGGTLLLCRRKRQGQTT